MSVQNCKEENEEKTIKREREYYETSYLGKSLNSLREK